MRIGTWNLAGHWSDDHASLLEEAACDVWLLTEVDHRTLLDGYACHASTAPMAPGRHWAVVLSRRPMVALADPHPASAAARVGAMTYVSSVLPWKGCGSMPPWVGENHVARTENALDELVGKLDETRSLIWGGDWNHAMDGPEYAGSHGGRRAVREALDTLRLTAPTATLPHVIDGLLSIDHVAVPIGLDATAWRIHAQHGGRRLSDHDAYVVDVDT